MTYYFMKYIHILVRTFSLPRQPVILNEPLLPSESYQGERGWEVLRRLSC